VVKFLLLDRVAHFFRRIYYPYGNHEYNDYGRSALLNVRSTSFKPAVFEQRFLDYFQHRDADQAIGLEESIF
tara:strand:- start:403 stop:618 length:216 start_codon:yes stop_codon:yes gene_type:complete